MRLQCANVFPAMQRNAMDRTVFRDKTICMDRLFSVLPKVLRKRGLNEHAEGALVVLRAQRWLEERFPALLDGIRVQKYQEHVLHIHCSHSIALQECQGAIPDLQDFLRKDCAFTAISDIRVSRN